MLILFTLMACLKITYTSGPAPITTPEQHEEWHHRFASGMIEAPGPFDAGAVCQNGVAQVRTEITIANSFASAAANQVGAAVGVDTSGVYTPSTIKVWCQKP